MKHTSLHVKLRPTSLNEVIGQDAVVKSLARLLQSRRVPSAFLFGGPSGVGKTTLARIIAKSMGCGEMGLVEVDGARFSGVEPMRELVRGARYVAMGLSPTKVIILDECHRMSPHAFDALLLPIEEPPPHLFWALCTTEPEQVPTAIRTRCHAYALQPVSADVLMPFLRRVRTKERLHVRSEFIELAVRNARGSVRQALVNLSMLDGIVDRREAINLLAL